MDQFCLKWNNFQTSLVTAFSSLQSTEELSDVTLTCEGRSIKAHKIILSACSPYFRTVFKENPCPHPIVILKDVSYNELISILNFMYHGEVLITQDQLSSFLHTAEALQVSGLVSNTGLLPVPERQHKPVKKPKKCGSAEKKFEALVDEMNIKTEEQEYFNNNTSENVDAYDIQNTSEDNGNEACTSILERSLTSQVVQQTTDQMEIDKSTKHKMAPDITELTPSKVFKYEDSNVNVVYDDIAVTPRLYSEQPHHSSQCGNCPHCGKVYSNQSALKYHVRLVHSDLSNMYCCHLCPEVFDFRDSYKKHMTDTHSVRN